MKTLFWTCVLALGVCGLSLAGPERPIRSTTFSSQSLCGPSWDPLAAQGQWFQDVASGMTFAKTQEFHDDDAPLSIKGIVTSITFDGLPASNIVAFTIQATVMNNLPSLFVQPGSSNSHNEVQMQMYPPYAGPMQSTRIVAEFAVATTNRMPSGQVPYYLDPLSGATYCIEAVNETEWAWYCWAPGAPQQPAGNFQVPTWVLGTIPPMGSQSVLMSFKISKGVMPISDYRHGVLRHSLLNQSDVFYNRHNSLKISHWLDTLLVDYGSLIMGAPGDDFGAPEYLYASNVSVFFGEEMDFGDAPAPFYPTLLVHDGARHDIPSSYYLGTLRPDLEPDGQPHPLAAGDDTLGIDDEDGVFLAGSLVLGSNTFIQVVASTNGYLNAWLDYDQNGNWDSGEQIALDFPLTAGTNAVPFTVSSQATLGQTFGRFRFSSYQGLLPTGRATDGEVEDYAFTLYQAGPTAAFSITNITYNASSAVVTIDWTGESSVIYETQYADALSSNMTWTAWGPYVRSAPYSQTQSVSGQTSRFYRVSAPYIAP